MEEFINPVMYEIPTETPVERCIITEAVVNGETAPEYIHNENILRHHMIYSILDIILIF